MMFDDVNISLNDDLNDGLNDDLNYDVNMMIEMMFHDASSMFYYDVMSMLRITTPSLIGRLFGNWGHPLQEERIELYP